jgi:hypothetical protein
VLTRRCFAQECEELIAKGQGSTGAGFDASGEKLGHRGGWGVAPSDPKAAAREAALKRAKLQGVMGGGGRLGGSGATPRALTPQEAAAAAAERRAAAQRFSHDFGLEDDAVEGPASGAGGSAQTQQTQQQQQQQQQQQRRQAPPPPPPPPRPRLAFDVPCVCGMAHAPGGAGAACAGAPRRVPRDTQRSNAPAGGSADAPIELLDDDDDDVVVIAEPAVPSRAAAAQQQRGAGDAGSCWLCGAAARRCACWSCRCERVHALCITCGVGGLTCVATPCCRSACTRRNANAATRCDTCDAWRFARSAAPAPP